MRAPWRSTPGPGPDPRGAPRRRAGHAARAVLRPRLRAGAHAVHDGDRRRADAGPASGEGLLLLALLWWAWVGYAWLTSVRGPGRGRGPAGDVRGDGCVPHRRARGSRGVRRRRDGLRRRLRRGARSRRSAVPAREPRRAGAAALGRRARRRAPRSASRSCSPARSRDGARDALVGPRAACWTSAARSSSGAEGWQLVPGHFAERHGLIIIIALGESIIAIGVGAGVDLTAEVIVGAVARRVPRRRALVDVLRRHVDRGGAAAGVAAARARAERAGARRVLVPALPDGGRDRARRLRDEEDAGPRQRSAAPRARGRARRWRRAVSPRPRARSSAGRSASGACHRLVVGARCCSR